MSLEHPLSASARNWRNADLAEKRPLQYAATLQPLDLNTPSPSGGLGQDDHPSNRLIKPAKGSKEKEDLPMKYPPSPYQHHSRQSSLSAVNFGLQDIYTGAGPARIGSDDWMRDQVDEFIEAPKESFNINDKGLIQLSTRIVDLGDLVKLPTRNYLSNSRAVSSQNPPSAAPIGTADNHPALPTFNLSAPGGTRTFSRVSSAPAAPYSAHGHPLPGRSNFQPAPSRLANDLAQSRLDEDETGEAPSNALMARPDFRGLAPGRGPMSRSKTGAPFSNSLNQKGRKSTELSITIANNLLTSLPSALFELTNITLLSLRQNKLTALPAAIGQLVNLTELNIAINKITELPSTILDLHRMTTFGSSPNPFIRPPKDSDSSDTPAIIVTESGRRFSPLVRHDAGIPRLTTICLNLLISPRPPRNLPPLLDCFEYERQNGKHPLLDVDLLHEQVPVIPKPDLRRMVQALKSADRARQDAGVVGRYGALGATSSSASDAFPRSHRIAPPDDAAINPYYSACPSPRHLEYEDVSVADRPSRRLFLHPAEEMIEWVEINGTKDLPIRWQGCSPGCLQYLLEDEDEFSVDDWVEDVSA